MTFKTIDILFDARNESDIRDDCIEAIYKCPKENLGAASFYAHPVYWEKLIQHGIIRKPLGNDDYYRICGIPVFIGAEYQQLSFVYFDDQSSTTCPT